MALTYLGSVALAFRLDRLDRGFAFTSSSSFACIEAMAMVLGLTTRQPEGKGSFAALFFWNFCVFVAFS
jgi:hypothetical protein